MRYNSSFSPRKQDFQRFRNRFDGSDLFFRGNTIHKRREKIHAVPEWAKHDSQVRGLLQKSFPALDTNDLQRERAGRWMRIILLYFRLGKTRNQVAAEMELSPKTVDNLVFRIQLAAQGLRTDGSGSRRQPQRKSPIERALEPFILKRFLHCA